MRAKRRLSLELPKKNLDPMKNNGLTMTSMLICITRGVIVLGLGVGVV